MLSPEANFIVPKMFVIGADNTRDGIYISLKNVLRCLICIVVEQGADGTQHTFTLKQATAGAGTTTGTNEKALLVAGVAYKQEAAALNNVLAAVTPTLGAVQLTNSQSETKLLVFDVIPDRDMDLANNFDCIGVDATDLGASNSAMAFALLEPRYAPLTTVFSD